MLNILCCFLTFTDTRFLKANVGEKIVLNNSKSCRQLFIYVSVKVHCVLAKGKSIAKQSNFQTLHHIIKTKLLFWSCAYCNMFQGCNLNLPFPIAVCSLHVDVLRFIVAISSLQFFVAVCSCILQM